MQVLGIHHVDPMSMLLFPLKGLYNPLKCQLDNYAFSLR